MVDKLCFTPQAPILTGYHRLYSSLFEDFSIHAEVVQAIAAARFDGLTRREIVEALPKLQSRGSLTRILNELEESGFIGSSRAFGK